MRIHRAPSLLLALPFLCACRGAHLTPDAAPRAEVRERIEQGRALLYAGQPAEAEPFFASAAELDRQALRSRMWVLRAWMDQGRSNDTLDAIDQLDREGAKGLDMTYLYGMAFARRAEGYLAAGVTDSSVQMNFVDATNLLKQVVDADGARYRDAYQPLARAAWFVQELDTARWAADRSIETFADSAESWLGRGRIAMAQFVQAEGEDAGNPMATALWLDACSSLQRAVELFGTPTDTRAEQALAGAATELGHALLWRKKAAQATAAYATAIAWAPEAFDYARTQQSLSGMAPGTDDEPCGFRAALEAGLSRFDARVPGADPRCVTLLWWLGWARFVDADWAASEEAFTRSLALAPESANSWFYIGLARQYLKDSEGALVAMRQGWEVDPAAMVATTARAGGSLRTFEALIVWCATQEPARNREGALLAEMLAEAQPEQARHWNNLGLFLRDEGEGLEIQAHKDKTPKPDPALLSDLYGRSFRAYQRALELNPDDPQLINDLALMLHYHLGPDLVQAETMYRHALELADRELAASDLSEGDRVRFEQTKKDIEKNLKRLLDPAAADAEDAAEAAAEAAKKAAAEPTVASPAAEKP